MKSQVPLGEFSAADDTVEPMRVQRYLARAGIASRRKAEDLIRSCRVTVDGRVAELGARVAAGAIVKVDGREIQPARILTLLVAHKPAGMVTTLRDPEGRPTVAALMPPGQRLHPVGRLDYDTSGLLLLTNDGGLTQLLSHPSFGVDKTYRVAVRGRLTPGALAALQSGMRLDDGSTQPALVRIIASRRDSTVVDLTIHEGRNRQVRRMLEELGFPVVSLTRTVFGPFALGELAIGAVREPTSRELEALRRIRDLASEDEVDG